jgi:hypothetical protein
MVGSQPGQIVQETLSQQNPSQKRAVGVARGVGLSSNPSIAYKTKQNKQPPPRPKTEGELHVWRTKSSVGV